jgi:hypothetical protein
MVLHRIEPMRAWAKQGKRVQYFFIRKMKIIPSSFTRNVTLLNGMEVHRHYTHLVFNCCFFLINMFDFDIYIYIPIRQNQ